MTEQTLYYGGDILPMTKPYANPEALVVTEGNIAFVGSLQKARTLCGSNTRQVDLQGKCLMPGFIDPHSHLTLTARYEGCLVLSNCETLDALYDAVAEAAADEATKKAGILLGVGYDHNFLAELAHPTKAALDKISKDLPICLLHGSGHSCVVNAALLQLVGITNQSQPPAGGDYGRDAKGELNGFIEEIPALAPVLMKVYEMLPQDMAKQLQAAQMRYASYGITTLQEGSSSAEGFAALAEFARQGVLFLDTVAYVMQEEFVRVRSAHPDFWNRYCGRLKLGGAKMLLDGSPQGRTAWMTEDYLGEGAKNGYPAHTQQAVTDAARNALEGGYQLLLHCNGDAAADQCLKGFALGTRGQEVLMQTLRPVMIHCQTVRDEQLAAMGQFGMIPSFFIEHVYQFGQVHLKNLGKQRARRISPLASAMAYNLPFTLHQDTPVLPPDMLHTVQTAVTRQMKNGKVLGRAQRIGIYHALLAITGNGAYAYHEEHQKGRLLPGFLADMVVLSGNPLKTPADQIGNLQVLETIKEGKTVFVKH